MPPRKKPVVSDLPGAPTVYPGKGMGAAQWDACRSILDGVFNARNKNRDISLIFRNLPNKIAYEDYYEAIPEPECLENISTQLGVGAYNAPEDFFKQIHLVFLNAKHYNEEGSEVYNDATRLEDQIQEQWKIAASASTFSDPDPYHRMPTRKSRPGKNRVTSSQARTSSTPMPAPITRSSITPNLPSISLPTLPPRSRSPSAISDMGIPSGSPTPSERLTREKQAAVDRQTVSKLQAKMPRWEGPEAHLPDGVNVGSIPGSGWWGDYGPDFGGKSVWNGRMHGIVKALDGYRDVNGVRLADAMDAVPPVADIPYLSFHTPLSFASIQANVVASRYRSLQEFDQDLSRLFEKCRRFHSPTTTSASTSTQLQPSHNPTLYGHILVLQRLYHALTAPYPLLLPPSGVVTPNTTNFASIPAGPGIARSAHETNQELKAGARTEDVGYGILSHRVAARDRDFTDEARFKGQSYRVGDYVHLINPDDGTRPIVGQIFKSFVPTKGYRTHHVTVCWYFRPEQIVHPADKMFYENELFKTGFFCDHPVEDIIEKVSCQFFVRFVRGLPQAGEYYPGWPLYICNSRYNAGEWLTVRIKNWNSCIPDELRQTNFMKIVTYPKQLEPEATMVKSPFLRGITGPGFIGLPRDKAAGGGEDEEDEDMPSGSVIQVAARENVTLLPKKGGRVSEREKEKERERERARERERERERQKEEEKSRAVQSSRPVLSQGQLTASSQAGFPTTARAQLGYAPTATLTPSMVGARGGGIAGPISTPTPGPGFGSGAVPGPSRVVQPAQPITPFRTGSYPTQNAPPSWAASRTFTGVLGGQQVAEQIAVRELLPPDTGLSFCFDWGYRLNLGMVCLARLFERDSRGQVLWFSGAPLPLGTVKVPEQGSHSLEYLEYLTKRKRGLVGDGGQGERRRRYTVQVEDTDGGVSGEVSLEAWWNKGKTDRDILDGLEALVKST